MKKQLSKRSLWQSILSVVALGIFILLAAGSDNILYLFLRDYWVGGGRIKLEDGTYQSTTSYGGVDVIIIGDQKKFGYWEGVTTIEHVSQSTGLVLYSEVVNMENGKRHGLGIVTKSDGTKTLYAYYMGHRIENKKAAHINNAGNSAYQIFIYKYPWYVYSLNTFGFENEYIEAYMDTLEIVLYSYDFEENEFDDYYEQALEVLEETAYDSIVSANSGLAFFQGLEEIKHSELRLAIIDRYWSDGNSTYDVVNITYPGYLLSLSEGDVTDQDFKGFCQVLDSCMTSYGSLDLEDPYFIDSVDVRLFRAILSIMDTEESSSSAVRSLKSAAVSSDNEDLRSIYSEVKSILKPFGLNSSPGEVSEVVLFFMFMQFDQGNIMKQAVRKAYLINNDVISVPTVATEFSGNTSVTSVTLGGYIIEDGGAAVTSGGIAWATFYNPTTDDHTETSGTGMGEFTVTLDGLTEGAVYYARTFATNSAGTAYGNCISFIAQSTLGINENTPLAKDFNIYPNPASVFTTFSFQVESSECIVLTIVNMKGQVVYRHDLGNFSQGENQVELDLSGIPSGMYHCQLTNNGTLKVTHKLVIVH